MSNFSIESLYQKYLEQVGLSEDQMHHVQRKQLRSTYFAGAGAILITLTYDVVEMGEEEGAQVIESMLSEVENLKITG